MSIMNSILLVLCVVITRIYGLDELSPTTTVSSASENLTELFIDQTTTELPVELIVTTYQPLLIPIPTTNPQFNNENIDNNVNDEKSEKFSPNIYAETIFLPVAPQNYRPDLTHESLSRSNKFNLLDFTSYIHPPVLPDLSGNSPDFPKAEKLVVSNPNVLKKSKKSKKSYKGKADHSNYPQPYAVHDDNYYPNNFYEYFKNDFYRNHRDRYDIDPRHYANPSQQQLRAPYYHPGGGTCPGGGGPHNLAQQAPPLYYNFALQPIKFDGHPKGRGESEEEEDEEDEDEEEGEEESDEEQEDEHQHAADDKKDKKEPTEEKTSEKLEKPEVEEEDGDYPDYNDEEEVEGDETDEEKKQNLKFRDTEEEERFHLDREKFRDDREKFRNDHEKFKSHDSDEDDDDDEQDYDEDEADNKKRKRVHKKSGKSKKKVKNDEDEEEYDDEDETSAEKPRKNKPLNKDVEIIDSTTTILPPDTQRVSTFQIAPRATQNSISNGYFPEQTATESPTGGFTTTAGLRRRTNLVQSKLKRLDYLPETTTPLIDTPTLIPTFRPRQQNRPNQRYTQLTTIQPFIINTNDDAIDPKAQYENIAEDAQAGKSELKSYTVAPRRPRLPPVHNQNSDSSEQYRTTPVSRQPENRALYSQNLYFAPREQTSQIPNPYQNIQPRQAYNHPTQIQRPQVFPLTPETPNLIQHPQQSRQIQSQSRIKKESYDDPEPPVNYQAYTVYKQKREIAPNSTTDIKYSSKYRILNENITSTNESDVAASYHMPVNITSGGRRTVGGNEAENAAATTTAIPDVKKTDEDDAGGKETETEEPPSRQDDGRKILNQVKYFQYANVFGNGSYNAGVGKGNPDHFILQQERADKNIGVFQKRVRWGDKKGGYGEHYWDLNHHKPKIEEGVSDSKVNSDTISTNNNNNSSKIQSAADDHKRDDHDG